MSEEITITSTSDSEEQIREALREPEAPASDSPEHAETEAAQETQPSEAAAEAAGKEADAPEESATTEQEDEAAEQQAKPPTKRDKRIDRLTREKYDLQRQLDEQRRRLESREPSPEDSKPVDPGQKPRVEDFETFEEFTAELVNWSVRDQIEEERKQFFKQEQERAQVELYRGWQQSQQAARDKYQDYDDVVASDAPVSPAMGEAIMDSSIGGEMLYWLGQNPKVCEQIANLSPVAAIRELGKLEAHLMAPVADNGNPPQTSTPAQQRPVSRAPEPITPVAGKGGKAVKHPDDMTQDEFNAWREKTGRVH